MPEPRLRLVIHDYGGHHFPAELGRALASQGFEILHLYFTQCLNPQSVGDGAPQAGYSLRGLSIKGEFQKFSFVRRRSQEIEYGKLAAQVIADFKPDFVISSTTPIDAQAIIQRMCAARGVPFLFWLQDIVSIAMSQILPKKLPVLGHAVAALYRWQEARILRDSDSVVVISEHFLPTCEKMGVDLRRCHVIENWAPLDQITPQTRPTQWAIEQGLADKRVILYSGTLGFKHNPAIFEHLCQHFKDRPDIRIVVVTEGLGGAYLQELKTRQQLDNLVLLPYQPYARLSEVLATGDIVLAILEEDAGIFSVPSKVLSYLAAGRPILLSVPLENLAAATVLRAKAGRVMAPRDIAGLLASAEAMLDSPEQLASYSEEGRAYALRTFNIKTVCLRFETIIRAAIAKAA